MNSDEILTRGVAEIIEKDSLERNLKANRPLKVKLGIDPTTPHLHLGHTVVLQKLAQFQALGHQAILVIGDFTALVGDPSGRDSTRPVLTSKQIEENFQDYQKQAGKILDLKKVTVRKNSEWLAPLGLPGLFELASKATFAQILKRKEFRARLESDDDLTVLEMLYPLMQAYDSVQLEADIELGGTDQKFNLLMGRQIQKRYGQKEQDILMTPLLVGLDGEHKMSKSLGNYISLTETPTITFGKLMSLPDKLLVDYFRLCTALTEKEIQEILASGPYLAKKRLGVEIVSRYHSKEDALKAKAEFERTFSNGKAPEDIPTKTLAIKKTVLLKDLPSLLVQTGLVTSNSEAKRLIEQRAVEVNDQLIDPNQTEVMIANDSVIKIGKHRFVKVKTND